MLAQGLKVSQIPGSTHSQQNNRGHLSPWELVLDSHLCGTSQSTEPLLSVKRLKRCSGIAMGGPRQFENPLSFFDVFGGYTHFLSHSSQRIWQSDSITSLKSVLCENVFFFSPTPRQRIKHSPWQGLYHWETIPATVPPHALYTYIHALYILIYMPCLCMDISKCLVALVRINHPTSWWYQVMEGWKEQILWCLLQGHLWMDVMTTKLM